MILSTLKLKDMNNEVNGSLESTNVFSLSIPSFELSPSINQSISQSTNKSINQSTNLSINQPIN